jgi:hypothetical protein
MLYIYKLKFLSVFINEFWKENAEYGDPISIFPCDHKIIS